MAHKWSLERRLEQALIYAELLLDLYGLAQSGLLCETASDVKAELAALDEEVVWYRAKLAEIKGQEGDDDI